MNYTDLDLSNVESTDLDKLSSTIESYYSTDNSTKQALTYNWERNHLMLDGQQWLKWDDNGGRWNKFQPSSQNEYIPRPVTNYIFDAYQTLKSYLLKNKPRSTVRPNTQSVKDKTSAKIAELILETNWEKYKETENYENAASCLLTYGTVFKKDYWDTSSYNLVKVPKMVQQPKFDPQTGQPMGMEEVQETDELGYPVFVSLPLGDVYTTIVEPYRIAIDPLTISLHEARWIMEYCIRPLSWIKENYGKEGEGFTGLAAEVKEEKAMPNSLRRFYNLRTSSGVRGTGIGTATSGSGSGEMIENAAIVKEYYERPCEKYPNGRLIVSADKKILYVGDSPYSGPEQGDWHPYSSCKWEPVPGRFWGKSPFDAAVEIQKQINSIDSVIILNRKTMAVPQKLVPHGSIAKGIWTGMPGQEVPYKPGVNGEKPELLRAMGVDNQVFAEREQRVNDFKNITGAVDILKGDRPPGVTAFSALSLLHEVGTGKLYPILDRWKLFVENSQKKQLRLIAQRYREPRQDFIKALVSKNSDLTEVDLKKFIGEDLNDNCNVVIEAASSIPKLKAAEHALLMELAQYGVLDLNNTKNRSEFLERFGILGFDAPTSKDIKRADWENDLMDNMMHSPDNRPVIFETDDDAIHIEVHAGRTKEPSFMALPLEIQTAYFEHIQAHEDAKGRKEQMQMMQAAAMGQPPQPPQQSPGTQGQPPQKASKGPGISEDTKKAFLTDIPGQNT